MMMVLAVAPVNVTFPLLAKVTGFIRTYRLLSAGSQDLSGLVLAKIL